MRSWRSAWELSKWEVDKVGFYTNTIIIHVPLHWHAHLHALEYHRGVSIDPQLGVFNKINFGNHQFLGTEINSINVTMETTVAPQDTIPEHVNEHPIFNSVYMTVELRPQ